ncbi:putative ester cyclase [Nitrospirillum amazonense]|uniref:Putative ester cyclase n=1 Tax=Nitrospirillum amazonense TaxID=28077 RepID=A0A560FFG2_9PROT|nr:ester cyclase [Nitrospirillum amazonense]TWB20336.1 putative ester cyclase [Nitrospirillum amazonense]
MSQDPIVTSNGLAERDRIAIETLYRAFSDHDPDLLDGALAPDWQDIPLAPGQAAGREGMKPLVHAFSAAFPDVRITIHELIGAPGRAAVRAEITGTHQGEWFGVAPTGVRFTIPIHEFHYVRDGRVTHTWHLEDWFGWLHQVGALGTGEKRAGEKAE